MKIIYSYLKKLLPKLEQTPTDLADDLSLIGHFTTGIKQHDKETVIEAEVRQNRPDCLSYWGIAHDLAAYYQTPLQQKNYSLPPNQPQQPTLPLEITAREKVLRLMAVELNQIDNKKPTPAAIKQFLILHDVNPINCVVDLTNYIMLWWGIPNHAFDAQKSGLELTWELNGGQKKQFTSFAGNQIKLQPKVLQIAAGDQVVSLAGIVGGYQTGVRENTTESLVEMAIYDPTRIRRDSQLLNVETEASRRLGKSLDPNLIPPAFSHLIELIQQHTGAQIASQVYDNYPEKTTAPTISLNPQEATQYAGIKISPSFAQQALDGLDCQIEEKPQPDSVDSNAPSWLVTPPTWRTDLTLKEDLIEEVIRLHGYDKIPTDEPISSQILPSITPKIIHLIKASKTILANRGYDEIRSWPLIREENLQAAKFLKEKAQPIYTENNVNANYPVLRQSLISSLRKQWTAWHKLKIPQQRFFEIGKIFWQENGQFREAHSLGIFHQYRKKMAQDLVHLGRQLQKPQLKPEIAAWRDGWVCEINLDQLVQTMPLIPKIPREHPPTGAQSVVELERQLVSLDANIFYSKKVPFEVLRQYQDKFPPEKLWQLEVIDIYPAEDEYKFTIRAYYNCPLEEAKKIHQKIFQPQA